MFVGYVNGHLAAFLSVLHFPHPKSKNIKKVHRLVVLPDYQGIGIGIRMLEEICKIYKKQKDRYTIVTSSPSLIYALKKSSKWRCLRFGRAKESSGVLKGATSKERITSSFEMK